MSVPALSVVIVSYQVRDLLERCLSSVRNAANSPALEIIVIDNASNDGTPEMVRTKFPAVQLVTNTENLGFSRANNIGLERARGRYWMLLNPDTEIPSDAPNPFQLFISFMDQHPRAAVCGASLFYPDGTRQHSAFRFPTLAQVYMDLFPVNWRLRESSWNGRYPFSRYERGEPFQIDHPLGAAFFVRPEAAKQVGLLDEDFFIYAEEVDWCMRFKRAGWQVWCVPQARIIHYEARSTKQFREKMYVALWQARLTLFRKNYSGAFNKLVRPIIRLGMERALRQAQRGVGGVTQEQLDKQMDAYRRVIELTRNGN